MSFVAVAADATITTSYEDCPICWEALTAGERARLECGHEFHLACSMTWHDTQASGKECCPMCRTRTIAEATATSVP